MGTEPGGTEAGDADGGPKDSGTGGAELLRYSSQNGKTMKKKTIAVDSSARKNARLFPSPATGWCLA